MAGRGASQAGEQRGLSTGAEIRPATASDAEAIAAIRNQGIEERGATFETRLMDAGSVTGEVSTWKASVVADLDGEVIAFAKAGPYEDGAHYYDGVGEATIFVERSARGQGLGGELLAALVEEARDAGLHKLTAKVFASNAPSLSLFKDLGFRVVGTHERHGELDGEWLDVVLLERSL